MSAVITREAMASEYDGTKRKSAKYYTVASSVYTEAEIENGMLVKIDSLESRNVFKVIAPSKDDKLADLWIVTTPEVDADERNRNLSDFKNKKGAIITIDKLTAGDIIGLENGLDGTAAVDNVICLGASGGVKMSTDEAATSLGTQIGKVLDINGSKVGIMFE